MNTSYAAVMSPQWFAITLAVLRMTDRQAVTNADNEATIEESGGACCRFFRQTERNGDAGDTYCDGAHVLSMPTMTRGSISGNCISEKPDQA